MTGKQNIQSPDLQITSIISTTVTVTTYTSTITTVEAHVGLVQEGGSSAQCKEKVNSRNTISAGIDSDMKSFKTPVSHSSDTASLDHSLDFLTYPQPVTNTEEDPTRTAVVLDHPLPLRSGSCTDLPPDVNLELPAIPAPANDGRTTELDSQHQQSADQSQHRESADQTAAEAATGSGSTQTQTYVNCLVQNCV